MKKNIKKKTNQSRVQTVFIFIFVRVCVCVCVCVASTLVSNLNTCLFIFSLSVSLALVCVCMLCEFLESKLRIALLLCTCHHCCSMCLSSYSLVCLSYILLLAYGLFYFLLLLPIQVRDGNIIHLVCTFLVEGIRK